MVFAEIGTWAEWGVVGATLLLALATVGLAIGANAQVKVAADHVVAIQRPLVTPVVTSQHESSLLPADSGRMHPRITLKNVGLGPAYNIKGGLYWMGGAGGASAFQTTTLGTKESRRRPSSSARASRSPGRTRVASFATSTRPASNGRPTSAFGTCPRRASTSKPSRSPGRASLASLAIARRVERATPEPAECSCSPRSGLSRRWNCPRPSHHPRRDLERSDGHLRRAR